MRIPFMSFIVLSAMVMTLSTPAPASAWSNLITFLALQACAGQGVTYKNGCFAYLEKRTLQCSSPDSAVTQANTQCDTWYNTGTNPSGNSICKQGVQFLRGKE